MIQCGGRFDGACRTGGLLCSGGKGSRAAVSNIDILKVLPFIT